MLTSCLELVVPVQKALLNAKQLIYHIVVSGSAIVGSGEWAAQELEWSKRWKIQFNFFVNFS